MKSSCNFKRILSHWIDMLILQSVFRSTGNLAETWSGEDYLTHVNILKTAKPLSSVCSWFECSLQKRLANESSDLNENQITFGKCLGHGLRMTLFFQNITCTSPDTNMFGFFFFPHCPLGWCAIKKISYSHGQQKGRSSSVNPQSFKEDPNS